MNNGNALVLDLDSFSRSTPQQMADALESLSVGDALQLVNWLDSVDDRQSRGGGFNADDLAGWSEDGGLGDDPTIPQLRAAAAARVAQAIRDLAASQRLSVRQLAERRPDLYPTPYALRMPTAAELASGLAWTRYVRGIRSGMSYEAAARMAVGPDAIIQPLTAAQQQAIIRAGGSQSTDPLAVPVYTAQMLDNGVVPIGPQPTTPYAAAPLAPSGAFGPPIPAYTPPALPAAYTNNQAIPSGPYTMSPSGGQTTTQMDSTGWPVFTPPAMDDYASTQDDDGSWQSSSFDLQDDEPLVINQESSFEDDGSGAELGSWLSSAFRRATGVRLSQVTAPLISSVPVVGGLVNSLVNKPGAPAAPKPAAIAPIQARTQQQQASGSGGAGAALLLGLGVLLLAGGKRR